MKVKIEVIIDYEVHDDCKEELIDDLTHYFNVDYQPLSSEFYLWNKIENVKIEEVTE